MSADVGARVDAAGHADAAAARAGGRLPAELVGGRLEHAAHALVRDVAQPELERVDARPPPP